MDRHSCTTSTVLISQEPDSLAEFTTITQFDKHGKPRLPEERRPRLKRDLKSNSGVESGTLVLPPGSTKFSEIAVGCEVCACVCKCV